MSDELIEPFAMPEIFVDGFAKHASRNGVMSCVGYRVLPDGNVAVVRLLWPASNTVAAIDEAYTALGAKRGLH